MNAFELYTFVVCFIVFAAFTLLFSYMIVTLTKMELEMIRHGLRDKQIKKEIPAGCRAGCFGTLVGKAVSLLLCLALSAAFCASMYMNMTESKPPNGIPSVKVVKSTSMAGKHEENTYLAEHGLDDQIQMFDLIVTRHLPAEEDLELYDIVVYKQDDIFVIHRIVGIEEPNQNHPEQRYFTLQGDAVGTPDMFPVLYSQMQGIYEGERIPFAGSFVLFLQSPAGWLCIILVFFATIATPIVEKKLKKAKESRLEAIDGGQEEHENEAEKISVTSNHE